MKKNTEITYREIYAQPAAFAAVGAEKETIIQTLDQVFAKPWDELIFTGCGTSFYLAQSAAFAYSRCTGKPAKAVPCSELYFYPENYVGNGRRVLVLPITRKSYTTEVRMAIDKARSFSGVQSLAITCDSDSRLYNDFMILSPEADEKSVIMTGSFTSMVYLSVLLALCAGGRKEEARRLTEEAYIRMAERLLRASETMANRILSEHSDLRLFVTLGQGVNYGIANECMNKIKEMGIADSEAYHTLEYRHGPMSLVDGQTLLVLLGNDESAEMDRALMTQMKGFGGVTLAVGTDAEARYPECDYHLTLEAGWDALALAPVMGFIGQFLGCAIAAAKGIDADTPRHLTQAIVLEK